MKLLETINLSVHQQLRFVTLIKEELGLMCIIRRQCLKKQTKKTPTKIEKFRHPQNVGCKNDFTAVLICYF